MRIQSLARATDPAMSSMYGWVQDVVIGLGLCPFAAPVMRRELLFGVLLESDDLQGCLQELADAAHWLLAQPQDEATLLVLPGQGWSEFERYLELLELVEQLLEALGLDGVLQVASFHPDYCFAGLAPDDPANATNRSPVPALHLLQEVSVSKALAAYPDPASIPERNQKLMRQLAAGKCPHG